MTDNVVQFEPRRRELLSSDNCPEKLAGLAPALFFEFRLLGNTRMQISLHDSTGEVGAVEFAVTVVSPPDFDLNTLRTEWDRLREESEGMAS